MKLTFMKKEMKEFFSTYRFFVLFGLFLFFAFLNAPLARFMKDLFGLMGVDDMGLVDSMPDPIFMDAYIQFFSNIATSMIGVVIIYMTVISGEVKRGTVYLILSKGLSRWDFYISKLLFASLMYTLAYLLSTVITVFYTWILFDQWHFDGILLAFLSYWLFGLMVLTITVSVSAMSKHSGIAALGGLVVLLFLPLTNFLGRLGSHLPGKLSSLYGDYMAQTATGQDLLFPALSGLLLMIIFVVCGGMLFYKKEL